jgi:hypothetical protein
MSTEYNAPNGADAPPGLVRANGKKPPADAPPAPKKDWLGDQLRDLYSSYTEEPLPDDLASLLDKLDDPDNSGSNSGNEAQ